MWHALRMGSLNYDFCVVWMPLILCFHFKIAEDCSWKTLLDIALFLKTVLVMSVCTGPTANTFA